MIVSSRLRIKIESIKNCSLQWIILTLFACSFIYSCKKDKPADPPASSSPNRFFRFDSLIVLKMPFEDQAGIPFDADGKLDPLVVINLLDDDIEFRGSRVGPPELPVVLRVKDPYFLYVRNDSLLKFNLFLLDEDTGAGFNDIVDRIQLTKSNFPKSEPAILESVSGRSQVKIYVTWK